MKDEPKKNKKQEQLEHYKVDDKGKAMRTNHGVKISEDEFSLKVGERGPTIMDDFHLREKITHFDHERIPERVVHARGSGAHGYFELYESMEEYTKAKVFTDTSKTTPVFVRFSTVVGFRGSADTVRDIRGFSTKFYTEEGNYDLVGNNMGVFFIQDAIKFPDLIHANKPEPHNEVPQATAAHDTFWDFVANNQETAHQVMWAMSDRGIARSYRMMDGFSINTFRFVNKEGDSHFVRLRWRPVLGVHGLVWDEAQKILGRDPDFHRKDLWEAIEEGNYPEYELGVQIVKPDDEFNFDFDILDPTKVWPEEEIPVNYFGKMTLNKNVDNFFAETEQAAFHPGHVVPGIDFSNDPLLQGRLFSYTDTQLIRLGGPNFNEIPINRPLVEVNNNQRDGYHRRAINKGPVAYHKNSMADNYPEPVSEKEGGYAHYQEKVDGVKIRTRSESFEDHFSHARMFWNSMSEPEKNHIIEAFGFEVGKVERKEIRQQVVNMYANVNLDLAKAMAKKLGVKAPKKGNTDTSKKSPALSMENTTKTHKTRKLAVILDDGFDSKVLDYIKELEDEGLMVETVSDELGMVKSKDDKEIEIDHTFVTADSVLYDATYAVGGKDLDDEFEAKASDWVEEAFMHCKPVAATGEGKKWIDDKMKNQDGVLLDEEEFVDSFIKSIAEHRHWDRKIY